MYWAITVAAVLLGIWLLLIAPGHATKAQRAPFTGRAYAHRGLYERDQSVPENSLAAFMRAVDAGYGIELDVQLTKDARIVVFHDDTLLRACGRDARLDAYTYEELMDFALFGTSHRIPLFSDVLECIGGRVPLIVELKAGGQQTLLCEKTCAMLAGYAGDYCIESFHPAIVRWFKVHAPHVLRGQLSEAYRFSHAHVRNAVAFVMSRTLSNAATRPQFIAYRIGPKCISVRLAEALGAMKVAWTAREAALHGRFMAENDAVIFEHYRP